MLLPAAPVLDDTFHVYVRTPGRCLKKSLSALAVRPSTRVLDQDLTQHLTKDLTKYLTQDLTQDLTKDLTQDLAKDLTQDL